MSAAERMDTTGLLEGVYKRLYTVDEFDRFTAQVENRDRLFELVHGEIVEKVPTEEHGVIVLRIGSRILVFVELHKLGYVGVEISHRLPTDRYNERLPDVSFRAAKPDKPIIGKGSVPRMPDFAVEVKSPNNTYKELREKAEYLIQNGTKLMWLVYPEKQAVEVCVASKEQPGALLIRTVEIDGVLDGGDVLPGFTLAVRDIFDIA